MLVPESAGPPAGGGRRPGAGPRSGASGLPIPPDAGLLGRAQAAVGLLVSAGVAGRSDAGCAELEQCAFAMIQRLEALRLAALRQVDASGQWREAGCGSAAGWLKGTRGIDHGRAAADVRAARATGHLPELAGALARGDTTRAHLDAVARTGMAAPERQAVLGQFDGVFTDVAVRCTPGQLSRVMASWADQLQPETAAGAETAAHQRRRLYLSPLPDGWDLRGFLGCEQGTALQAVLNAEMGRDFRNRGQAGGGSNNGNDEPGADGSRSPADTGAGVSLAPAPQRRADALLRIAGIAAAAGDLPRAGGLRPVVAVTVPLHRLEAPGRADGGAAAGPCSGPGHPPPGAEHLTRSGLTGQNQLPYFGASAQISAPDGTGQALISAGVARRITCDSRVYRILLSPDGLPLDVGRTTRTIPHRIRAALALRDGGCVYPGCDKPPGWCEGHHATHWAAGGPTSLNNLALLCDHHHRVIHDHDLTIKFTDGRPRVSTRIRGSSP